MTSEVGMMCAGFVAFFVLLFGLLALMRWFRHRETMAMIQQGLEPSQAARPRNGNGRSLLIWGVGIGVFGLVLMLVMGALWMVMLAPSRPSVDAGAVSNVARSMLLLPLPGLTVLFAGVALLILYFAAKPTRDARAAAASQPAVEPELETIPPEPPSVEFEAKVDR
jgi:sterol desaturase/sphingolipid hydroxylase (fatty acid hydroxylase superfamily)